MGVELHVHGRLDVIASDSARKQELVEDEIGITILDPGLVDAAGVGAVQIRVIAI